jgi:energy-converting hydrogenase Eha subunit C
MFGRICIGTGVIGRLHKILFLVHLLDSGLITIIAACLILEFTLSFLNDRVMEKQTPETDS